MNIERHISNLKQYIKDDEIIEKDGSDFANFCKGHIDDIQAVLNELETLKLEIELSNKLIVRKNARLNEYAEDIAERDKIIEKQQAEIENLKEEEMLDKADIEEIFRLRKENEKKDKVIDEMV